MKKNITFVLICLLAIFVFQALSAAEEIDITLPSGLQEIKADAFRNDTSLHTVTLQEGIEKIGAHAFAGSGVFVSLCLRPLSSLMRLLLKTAVTT